VDSAQSFDIMNVLRPVVWTQRSHYELVPEKNTFRARNLQFYSTVVVSLMGKISCHNDCAKSTQQVSEQS
jgi:hypothetical protein